MTGTSRLAPREDQRLQRRKTLPLDGAVVAVERESGVAARTCRRHLAFLGAAVSSPDLAEPDESNTIGEFTFRGEREDTQLACTIRWEPDDHVSSAPLRSEALIQAACGLMEVHGREARRPRRIGLDIASVAAGVVATQAVLAAAIARLRGCVIGRVDVTVLESALLFLSHHVAIATSGDDFLARSAQYALDRFPDASPGPPWLTADGYAVELEALSSDSWADFWSRLGAPRQDVAEAWQTYVFRYLSAWSLAPASLHRAAAAHPLSDLHASAAVSGCELRRVRGYEDILRERAGRAPNGVPWEFRAHDAADAYRREHTARPGAPLAGIRVIDLTTRLQGPLATHLLRLLGADVIRVEPPGGDIGRVGPIKSLHGAYLAYNRGKQVVEIDFHQPEGRRRVLELIASADVYLHNWRPGRAARLRLDADDMVGNPGLVYAHASGWGEEERDDSAIAGDYLVQAHAGCAHGVTPDGASPRPSRVAFVDILGGLIACEGVLAALYQRERTGRGCRVDTSLLSGADMLQYEVLESFASGRERARHKGRPVWGPFDVPIDTLDGALMLRADSAADVVQLADACSVEGARDDVTLAARIAQSLQHRTALDWSARLTRAGVSALVVPSTLAAAADDPRVAPLLEPTGNGCRVPAAPWRFDGTKPTRHRHDRLPPHARLAQIVGRLAASAEALGALSGALRLRTSLQRADPAVEAALADVIASLGAADLLDDVDSRQINALGGLAQARLMQAADLCNDPAAAPVWQYTSPEMLRAQGRGSSAFGPVLREAIAPRLDGLVERLGTDGSAMLDVGVGVAALSLALARLWPRLRVVGLDTWEPALAIARQSVADAGMTDRIALRLENVAQMTDLGAFDLIWMPISFIAPDVLSPALGRLYAATRPGGWIIANMYAGMDDLTSALARLRTIRSGGVVLPPSDVEAMLRAVGFEHVHTLPSELLPPVSLTVGRRPTLPEPE
ncbi:MAG TPA: CoA transferase [Gemmatimonadaceae bacterium]|nr:CoA transferase [Gemmatimonadaceae bacterium]